MLLLTRGPVLPESGRFLRLAHAGVCASGDRIMAGQNHNDIFCHPVRHTDIPVPFGKFFEGHHQAPVVLMTVRESTGLCRPEDFN